MLQNIIGERPSQGCNAISFTAMTVLIREDIHHRAYLPTVMKDERSNDVTKDDYAAMKALFLSSSEKIIHIIVFL